MGEGGSQKILHEHTITKYFMSTTHQLKYHPFIIWTPTLAKKKKKRSIHCETTEIVATDLPQKHSDALTTNKAS